MNVTQLLHKLWVISNVKIVVTLLPEMIRIANQTPRYSLLLDPSTSLGISAEGSDARWAPQLQRIGKRIPLRFAEQEVDMLRHDYISVNVEFVTTPHPFQG
jgi:hypothetical protein